LANNVYECLFILDSNRYARDPNGVASTIPAAVEEFGGEVLASRLWNEQKLAYPIKGHRKGTYWLTYFRLAPDQVTSFNRACQLNDNILRHMAIRVDDRLVDVLVSHALGKPVAPAGGADEAGPEAKESEKKETAAAGSGESE
jgi:small subunit ribosomal protein S6